MGVVGILVLLAIAFALSADRRRAVNRRILDWGLGCSSRWRCLGGKVPERRKDLAQLGIRSSVAGSLATFLTGTIAGLLSP